MAKFFVNRAFQFGGNVRREGSTLTISDEEVKAQVALGEHPDNGKPLSGLLCHCSPSDKETAALCKGKCKEFHPEEAPTEAQKKAEAREIRKEFEAIGASFDPRWTLGRLRKELVKAKKEKGA